MSEGHIYAKIKDYIHSTATDSSLLSVGSNYQLRQFTEQFPQLTPHQIRAITKTQEQKILQRVVSQTPSDLYRQISRICPQVHDIESISGEEITSRLNLYSTKLILTERPTCQSESEQSWQQAKSESFFGDVRFDMGLMDQENENEGQEPMRNIFEECDNNPCWNNTEYFGLS